MSGNRLCGVWYDIERGTVLQKGTYTAEGIQAIADALRVNTALTLVDVTNNHFDNFGEEGRSVLRQAVEGRAGFDLKL